MTGKMDILNTIFSEVKPIIGMIHLRPLPGAPLYNPDKQSVSEMVDIAVKEAKMLEKAGVDGLQIENIWDYPYLKGKDISYETVCAMTRAAMKVKEAVDLPIGINCHLNGGEAALAVAVAVEAKWIRIFEFVNAYISHTGLTEGIGGKLARYRSFLKAEDIKFFSDVNVKHGSHFIISDRSVSAQAHDAESEGTDAIIITGFETGKAPTAEKVKTISDSVKCPTIIGSGTTSDNVKELLSFADAAIVGSYFKKNNNWKNPIDEERTSMFMNKVKELRKEIG